MDIVGRDLLILINKLHAIVTTELLHVRVDKNVALKTFLVAFHFNTGKFDAPQPQVK